MLKLFKKIALKEISFDEYFKYLFQNINVAVVRCESIQKFFNFTKKMLVLVRTMSNVYQRIPFHGDMIILFNGFCFV